jgi:transposase-like protein
MKKKQDAAWNKQAIISQYLTSEESFETLSVEHGVPARTIQSWVRLYRNTNKEAKPDQEQMSAREKELQAQVEQLRLKNELLEEMLKLSEAYVGMNLRKKFGARQS